MKHDLIALIDMDGTIADYDAAMRRDLMRLIATEEQVLTKFPGKTVPAWGYVSHGGDLHWLEGSNPKSYWKARMDLIKNQPGWWRNLEPIPKNFALIEKMRELGFDLQVLTKGPWSKSQAWAEKVEWCKEHIPDAEVHITGAQKGKGLVYGKLLMDDFPPYIESWLKWRKRGFVIMPAHPWNKGAFADDDRVIRYDGSDETYAAIVDRLEEIAK